MRSILRLAAAFAILTADGSFAAAAEATPAEDAYSAARDAAIATIKAASDATPHPGDADLDRIDALDDKERAGLEAQMRAIIGPVAIKGMSADAKLNLDTLNDGFEGFGLLDGMVYGAPGAKTHVIVTTDALFRRWLRGHKDWNGDSGLPQDPATAVKTDLFYTQAIQTDAAIVKFVELPVAKPADARFAFAMLAARTQSDAPKKADEVFVAISQGGRTFVAYTNEFTAVGPIPACDRLRGALAGQAADAAKANGPSAQDKADALSARSEAEFLSCFAQKATRQPAFAAAVKAAQSLLGRLPLH
jgi:hypothetical protein